MRSSMSSRTPIRPVEQTATSTAPSPEPSGDVLGGGVRVWKPSGPVQALAPPEFSTTARTSPSASDLLGTTAPGAALQRLEVNTPAAA